ncbi:KLTH0H12474p [Lachancea thermotolerans CBS 6340]|uniref:Protein DOM34 homolog n=1 Tax=Lachancea thermotolerans (strain ATCC 56472 / CBS 6340 / NRRL Y-8284) TaxID=559295 RepID=C5E3D5_LACTC|nr:KLTH0H12474p [Lachancea thermotolerans CBS 6340]CAR30546.1 KLTH0H12474p [Lachancea thermotolerans CBS 6340]
MKLISQVTGNGNNPEQLTLLPQDKEDLFCLYNIINTDDEVIFKRMVTSKVDSTGKKKTTELIKLRLRIVSSEFEPQHEFLRYKGITTEDESGRANVDIPLGKYFSFTVDYKYSFTLLKYDYNNFVAKQLKEACNLESRSDIAAIVLQEGIAHICLLSSFSTILKNKIEYSLPKKKRGTDVAKFDEKVEKFYKATYESMKRHFDFAQLKVILLCSPGFYAKTLFDKILSYAQEEQNKTILANKSRFLVAHCSTGYLQGINEVLKNPAYGSRLQDAKNSKEALVMDEFLQHLNDDDFKAWYGEAEVTKASEMGAIDTLLVTDGLLRSDDLNMRKKCVGITQDVERAGGSVVVFSSLHSSGEELDRLTGLACILKFPIPDLDEFSEEDK